MEKELICVSDSKATHRLILLHGWGADANDLIPLGQELIKGLINQKIELLAFRAPQQHPEGFGRQWYGLFPPDWAEVPSAISDLQIRIKALCKTSIPLEKSVILGFSQGGAMALAAGCDLPIAGLIGCSSYSHPNWTPPKNSPPALLIHGSKDEVVPCAASRKIFFALKTNQKETDFVEFDGGHEIPIELIPRIQKVLKKWFI